MASPSSDSATHDRDRDIHLRNIFLSAIIPDHDISSFNQPPNSNGINMELGNLIISALPKNPEMKNRPAVRTPEQRAKHAERERIRRSRLPENRAKELRARHAERERIRRRSLSPEKLAEERARHAERERIRRRNMPEEVIKAQRARRREQKEQFLRSRGTWGDSNSEADPEHVLSHIIPQEEIFDAVLTCTPMMGGNPPNIHVL
jgi:hypothetical protein